MKTNSIKFSVYYVLCYALAFIVYISLSLYMTELGYSPLLLATMLSVTSGLLLLFRFVTPKLIDGGSCHKAMAVSTVMSLLGAAVFFLIPGISPAKAVCYTVLGIGGYQIQMGLTDSWVMKTMETDPEMDYGKVRSFGSIAYAVTAVVYGWALNRFGLGIAFWSILILEILQFGVTVTIPDDRRQGADVGHRNIWGAVLRKPSFFLFVLCYLLPSSIYALMDNYMPVLILERGGTSFHAGLSSFVMASIEFVFLMFYTKVANRIGTRNTLVLGMIGYFFKAVIISLMPTPTAIIAACVTQMISFCLFIPSVVRYIQETNAPEEAASAYSLLQVIDSVFSTIVANPAAGVLKEKLGTGWMLSLFGILSAVSGVAFWLLTRNGIPVTHGRQDPQRQVSS